MVMGFGFILSYAVGSIFSSGQYLPPLMLSLYTFSVHYALFRLNLNRPPGKFFFVMLACIVIAAPKNMSAISSGIGYVALGVMISCTIGLIYRLLTLRGKVSRENMVVFQQNQYSNITESIIYGTTGCKGFPRHMSGKELCTVYWAL